MGRNSAEGMDKTSRYNLLSWRTAGKILNTSIGCFSFLRVLQEKQRADERTRTADLLQLRVIGQWLQGCKSRISTGFSLLCLDQCCTVLRSRWYQSGVNTPSRPRDAVVRVKFSSVQIRDAWPCPIDR